MKMSLTAKLVLFFSTLTLFVLFSLGWVLSKSIEHHFQEMDLAELKNTHRQIQYQLEQKHGDINPINLVVELEHLLPLKAGWQFILYDQNYQQFYTTHSELYDLEWNDLVKNQLVEYELGQNVYRSWVDSAISYQNWKVVALLNINHHIKFMHYFMQILWVSLLLAIPFMALFGWLIVGHALSPLNKMSELSAKVSSDNLGDRLELKTQPKELRELASVFNAMLDRLESSFQRLSQFSTDIAHELRTPINNLMTQSQVALTKARSAQEYQEVLASNIEEFERLSRMINDMLFLAKADKGWLVPQTEKVDLTKEAQRLVEYYQLLASERNVEIELTGQACVRGDAVMLGRAMANLLSNAVHHAEQSSVIKIDLTQKNHHAWISVENRGEDIPAKHWPYLFDRFYRADPSRRAEGGAGLGLAITRSIIQAHGGDIDFSSRHHRTVFRIWLPESRGNIHGKPTGHLD